MSGKATAANVEPSPATRTVVAPMTMPPEYPASTMLPSSTTSIHADSRLAKRNRSAASSAFSAARSSITSGGGGS